MSTIEKREIKVMQTDSVLSKSFSLLLITFLFGHQTLFGQNRMDDSEAFVNQLFAITEIMVTDVASPPAAARFYAYSTLGAQIIMEDLGLLPEEKHLSQKILREIDYPVDQGKSQLDPAFASIYSMLQIGKSIMPSGKSLLPKIEKWTKEQSKQRKWNKKVLAKNIEYADQVASLVLDLAKNDGYLQLSTLTRYSPKTGEGRWYPTPPAYMAAVEPEWRTIKPFFLKDIKAYKPKPPAVFSLEEGSDFKKQLLEVFSITQNLDEEKELIANFWDCNPFMVSYSGHMAIGLKKISPGGHWMGITGIATLQAKLPLEETVYVHALLAMTLHDAFISCWEEKYDSDRIRPETAINKYIDQKWRPLLQTPPFPEYTSGHSVISRASAVVLTAYFGDDFAYLDTSEEYFGLPARHFDSFLQAADEAAISRLYGGIHFRDAIDVGVQQGDKIGRYILNQLDPTYQTLRD
ncbi:vanadium-dependent haloperoxidase [Pararhodonellum marinum]|uniref:vanadium-dependent haloperoxidase n=1 Tax=Pararhodonellum marinum TaxID=2755358 RepID=UPI001E3F7D5B|nr:vanadium-dependent haloperoxidase [Pararhodonellum marinum]